MAHRNKRPNKRRHYITRMAGESFAASPLELALNRLALLPPVEREAVIRPVHEAFAAFRLGQGTEAHWARLADAMNIAADLAEHQIASDHRATFEAGKAALCAVMERQAQGGSWTLRGGEIGDLDLAVIVHEVQLQHVSRGELGQSVGRVIARVRGALAGNVPRSARVYTAGQQGAAAPSHV